MVGYIILGLLLCYTVGLVISTLFFDQDDDNANDNDSNFDPHS